MAGDYNLDHEEGHELKVQVSQIFVHPEYNKNYNSNDIALLKLEKDLEFDSYIQPACLPNKGTEDLKKKELTK